MALKIHHRSPGSGRGFTIVELLVVIAIIGVLVSLLFPAIGAVREQGRRVTCQNNLRNLGLAIQQYVEGSKGNLPPMWRTARPNPWDNFGWRADLLPYLEQRNLYDRLDLQQPPFAEANLSLTQTPVELMTCPSTPGSPRKIQTIGFAGSEYVDCFVGASDYFAVFDVQVPARAYPLRGIWNVSQDLQMEQQAPDMAAEDLRSAAARTRPASLAAARDGLSCTVLIVEQAGRPGAFGTAPSPSAEGPAEGPWASAEWGSFSGDGVNVDNRRNPFGFHNLALVVMADASVHAWSPEMSPDVLRALLSADGREIIQDTDWK
jgi:prepilin-type N-terminal cleavage/methylation domain-containing protein